MMHGTMNVKAYIFIGCDVEKNTHDYGTLVHSSFGV